MAFDVAVFGSSALSQLLAGLLARTHGRSVCIVGEPWSPWRLQRRFDVGVLAATRPATWSLLRAGSAETTKLLNGIGKGLTEPIDPVLIAETPASLEALAHMRATAVGLGYAMERIADRSLGETAAAWRLRDVPTLVHGKAEPALAQWLERLGVRRLQPNASDVAFRRDGTVRIRHVSVDVDATQAIIADDASLLAWLPEAALGRLRVVPARTILTEPAKPIAAPWVRYLDRGVTLGQRGRSGITAIATGPEAAARIGASLAPQAPLRRAGDVSHQLVETSDGAPLVALAPGSRMRIITGFGDAGAFFAPALARFFAGASTPEEAAFFATHDFGRGNARQQVADLVLELA